MKYLPPEPACWSKDWTTELTIDHSSKKNKLEIWKCWFLRRGENRSTRGKTSRSREENQQQTQPTYDAGSGNRTRDTLVGGERSHHCAIPAPLIAPPEDSITSMALLRHSLSNLSSFNSTIKSSIL